MGNAFVGFVLGVFLGLMLSVGLMLYYNWMAGQFLAIGPSIFSPNWGFIVGGSMLVCGIIGAVAFSRD